MKIQEKKKPAIKGSTRKPHPLGWGVSKIKINVRAAGTIEIYYSEK